HDSTIRRLAYKPERRYVAQTSLNSMPQAVVRAYTADDFPVAARIASAIASSGFLHVPRFLGASERRKVIAVAWEEGDVLADWLGAETGCGDAVASAAAALADFHRLSPPVGLPTHDRASISAALVDTGSAIAVLCPELKQT